MNLKRIYSMVVRQMFLIMSNPTRVAGILLWVVIDLLIWGFVTKYLQELDQTNFTFGNVILGAIILWDFTSRMGHGTMTGFLEDMWSHNYINFFSAPLKVSEYLAGLIMTSVITGIFAFGVMLILAGAAFGYNLFQLGILLLPFIFILFLFGIAIGIFTSALIFRLGPSAEWLGWPIPLILSVFAGVFYPVSILPGALQVIASAVPASYVFEGMRQVLAYDTLAGLESKLWLGFALSLAYLLLSYYYFIKVYKHNLKTGAIAKFYAE